jgi:hypothetical protein
MVSSAERPLPVARGGRFRHNRGAGQGQNGGKGCRCQQGPPRPSVGSGRTKLYDVLSVKSPRCTVGSHILLVLVDEEGDEVEQEQPLQDAHVLPAEN